jgi:hypothetical protein
MRIARDMAIIEDEYRRIAKNASERVDEIIAY